MDLYDYKFVTVGRWGVQLEAPPAEDGETKVDQLSRQRLITLFEIGSNPNTWGSGINEGASRFFNKILNRGLGDPLLHDGQKMELARVLAAPLRKYNEFLKAALERAK
jgi:hypothetical protein